MEILLINVPMIWAGKRRPVYPLGLNFIATHLAGLGHPPVICDLNTATDPHRALIRTLDQRQWGAVGLSLRNCFTFDQPAFPVFKNVVETVKRRLPDTPLICGGGGFSHYPVAFMERIPGIDFGVFGEGEAALERLIAASFSPTGGVYHRRNGRIIAPRQHFAPDLSRMAPLRYDWPGLDIRAYRRVGFQTKRGCPHRCRFCLEPTLATGGVRCQGDDWVAKSLENLGRLGHRRLFITDPVFNAPPASAERVLPLLRDFGGDYHAFVKPVGLTRSFLQRMADAGFKTFSISVESGAQRLLDLHRSPIRVARALRYPAFFRNRRDIDAHFTFIIGFKGERPAETLATIAAAWKVMWRSRFRARAVVEPYHIDNGTVDAASPDYIPDPERYESARPLMRYGVFPAVTAVQKLTDRFSGSLFMAGKQ